MLRKAAAALRRAAPVAPQLTTGNVVFWEMKMDVQYCTRVALRRPRSGRFWVAKMHLPLFGFGLLVGGSPRITSTNSALGAKRRRVTGPPYNTVLYVSFAISVSSLSAVPANLRKTMTATFRRELGCG